METVEAGHRTLPTGAGTVVDAWGPTRAECFGEAVRGLVATFADPSTAETSEPAPVHVDHGRDEELLAALLDEALSLTTVLGLVPVDGAVGDTEDGGLAGCLDVAPIAQVRITGPVPRKLRDHRVDPGGGDRAWRCRVTAER